jgi:hypothetical protein
LVIQKECFGLSESYLGEPDFIEGMKYFKIYTKPDNIHRSSGMFDNRGYSNTY